MNLNKLFSTMLAVVLSMSLLPAKAAQNVEWTIDEVTTSTITVTFTPNDEVEGYAACLFEAGTAETQFNMFGAWMGFTCMGDMVKAWGFQSGGTASNTWTNQSPGTAYDILVQSWDAEGNYGELITISIMTQKLGGEGQAEITITIGDFGSENYTDENGVEQTAYYQWVTFTPNDQVSVFHDMIIEAATYETDEWGEQGVTDYLQGDNPSSWWNRYGVDSDRWNVDPGTRYYAVAMGQNVNGEWGPLAIKEFTTPGATTGIADRTSVKETSDVKTYDLMGRALSDKSVMKKGLYIVGGRKMLVK